MDRAPKKDWSWLPTAMPKVAQLVAEKKKAYGAAHVSECWKRGVELGEPGWFFAREGGLAVGTPWEDDEVLRNFGAQHITSGQGLLLIKEPANGAH